MARIAVRLINWYQDQGGGKALLGIECCFSPTCSQYTKESIIKYGLLRGSYKGLKRIYKCRI
ncbi:MAG: membrane protein insertion efficiency factor YidD [Halobacteriovoraceae bacterium]|nr:membrane protein insertion efficiency factor YidD [Halobacteriovoraceae bacterium]